MSQTTESKSIAESGHIAVDAKGIFRRYGRRWALVNIGFQLEKGALLLVAGHNGSGKSTLFRVLSTAIRADKGTARIHGAELSNYHEVRKHIALLGHNSYTYEPLSALENLAISARLLGQDASREKLLALLDRVQLKKRADDPVATFSAGMRKRIAFARVLQQEAPVVFLDEPYGQLDPQGFRFVDDLLITLKERGTTVLMATHLVERGAEVADYGILLDHGNLIWSGQAKDIPLTTELDAEGAHL